MTDLFKLFAEAPELVQVGAMEMLVEDFVSEDKEAFKKVIQLKAIEKFVKEAKAKLSEKVLNELDQENNRTYQGFQVYKSTSPTKYVYDHNEDWTKYESKLKAIKKEQKAIEDKMKLAFKNNLTILDEETGEVFEPAQYKSGGQETFTIR